MNHDINFLLGLIALNNGHGKYAAIRRDDLFEAFKSLKNGKLSFTETEFSFLIERLKYDKVITDYYEQNISAMLICSEHEKLAPIIGDLLNDQNFLKKVICFSPYLNHLINAARVENRNYPYTSRHREASSPLKQEYAKHLEEEVIDKIIRNFDSLKWSGLRCSEVSGKKPVWYSEEFDPVSRIFNLCYYFKTRIDNDTCFRNIILKKFRGINTEDYTANFLVALRYQEIHEVLQKYVDTGEINNTVREHFKRIKNINGFTNYIRAWGNSVRSYLIQSLADQNKKSILERLSHEIYNINENPHTLQTNLLLILKYLNWNNELKPEREYLNKKIHVFTGNRICPECYTRKMVFMEGVICCHECGFSMEL